MWTDVKHNKGKCYISFFQIFIYALPSLQLKQSSNNILYYGRSFEFLMSFYESYFILMCVISFHWDMIWGVSYGVNDSFSRTILHLECI